MKAHTKRATIGLLLALLVAPRAARAQQPTTAPAPKPSKSKYEAARLLLKDGNRLLRAGACADALKRYRQAEEIYPESHRIKLNLGTALECLGRRAAAARRFEQYLRGAGRADKPQVVRQVRAKLKGLRRRLGSFTVVCTVAGAEVSLDGKKIGRTPLATRIYVAPGAHQLQLSKAGRQPFARQLTLAAGSHRRVVVPWAAPGMAPPPRGTATTPPAARPPAAVAHSRPFYKTWWFWTAVGVVVAGAATGGILASQLGGSDRMPQGELGEIDLR